MRIERRAGALVGARVDDLEVVRGDHEEADLIDVIGDIRVVGQGERHGCRRVADLDRTEGMRARRDGQGRHDQHVVLIEDRGRAVVVRDGPGDMDERADLAARGRCARRGRAAPGDGRRRAAGERVREGVGDRGIGGRAEPDLEVVTDRHLGGGVERAARGDVRDGVVEARGGGRAERRRRGQGDGAGPRSVVVRVVRGERPGPGPVVMVREGADRAHVRDDGRRSVVEGAAVRGVRALGERDGRRGCHGLDDRVAGPIEVGAGEPWAVVHARPHLGAGAGRECARPAGIAVPVALGIHVPGDDEGRMERHAEGGRAHGEVVVVDLRLVPGRVVLEEHRDLVDTRGGQATDLVVMDVQRGRVTLDADAMDP